MSGAATMYLDTHVVVWLYQKDESRFSRSALELIESRDLVISPIVLLELEYLFETGRITTKSRDIYGYLQETIQIESCGKPFSSVVARAIGIKWTRDPFDRLITSHASIDDSDLLTKDTNIHTYYQFAVW